MDVTPIGWVSSPRTEPLDHDGDAVTCTIARDAQQSTDEAPQGLQEFSHLEVVYLLPLVR
jgi:tRNA (adenine37-N6)-methyltransferase